MDNYLPHSVSPADTSFRRAWNKLLDWCKRNTLKSSSDILVTQTSYGTSLTVVKKPNQQAAAGAGAVIPFVGEYDPTRTYNQFNQSIISFGSNAGTYVAISLTPFSGQPPWTGNGYWIQLPMGQLGTWL